MNMFEGSAFLLLWAILPYFLHKLLQAAEISLWRFTIPSFVIVSFYVTQYVGLPILYFQLDEYRFTEGVDDTGIVLQVFFYTGLTMTLMILGFAFARKSFGHLRSPASVAIRTVKGGEAVGLSLLFILSTTILLAYLGKVGFQNIALLVVIDDGTKVAGAAARSAMGNSFEGRYYWYSLFMNKLMLFVALAFFVQALICPHYRYKVIFGIVCLVTTFSMVMAIEKAPMANFIIALFLAYVVARRGGDIPVKPVIYLAVFLAVLLGMFYIIFMRSESYPQALLSAFSRVTTGQIQPAYHYLEFFPAHHDFLLGRSFPNPRGLLPFKPFALTKEIAEWKNPGLAMLGIVGSMPTVYWGEMYANFGLIGVVIPPFFVGFLLYWMNDWLMRFEASPMTIALFVWAAMHFKDLSGTSLSGYMLDTSLLFICLTFIVAAFIGGRGAIEYRSVQGVSLVDVDQRKASEARHK